MFKEVICIDLFSGLVKVVYFYEDCVYELENYYCEGVYCKVLFELESDGVIEVIVKD